jgi:aspartyl-tRNA(Asn)/glutamyl-tRNA(Gln) amidotransferase subunit A
VSTVAELSAQVRSGERSAREVVDDHLAAIEERDEQIHAFNLVLTDAARAAADDIDRRIAAGEDPGPLAGVPVALKDNLCTRGTPTTCSSRILEGWSPPYDATVVTRLAAAGALVIGKTNLDEFAMGSSTENSAFGVTRNPHDVSRVPGGSSGGSAAAVAAGFAPLALGSDTGGSIRQPAALCGVVGMKPTYGRVSRYGLVAFASSLDQIGPFANTVADAALLFDVIAGHDPRDTTSIPEALSPVSPALAEGVDGLRIGLISELSGEGISPDVVRQLGAAADALEACGAKVGDVSVPSTTYGVSAYYLIAPAEASSNLARYDGVRYGLRVDAPTTGEMMEATRTAGFGAEVKRRIMLGTYALSAGYWDAYYGKALRVRTLMLRDFEAAYEQYDLLLAPTAPTTAFEIGAKSNDPLAMYLSDVCTIPSNLVGHPAISVPFGAGDDGLPVGVQILAPSLDEQLMFRAAAALEASA